MFYKEATIASFLSAVRITARVVIFLPPIRGSIIGMSAIVFFLRTLFRNPHSLPAEASAQAGAFRRAQFAILDFRFTILKKFQIGNWQSKIIYPALPSLFLPVPRL
jgi:hypothetical protein